MLSRSIISACTCFAPRAESRLRPNRAVSGFVASLTTKRDRLPAHSDMVPPSRTSSAPLPRSLPGSPETGGVQLSTVAVPAEVDRKAACDDAPPIAHAQPFVRKGSLGSYLFRVLSPSVLPHDYPRSVTPDYAEYHAWQALSLVAASATGVLSTTALLTAVGVDASAAGASAASLSWILKDVGGSLARVLFAGLIENRLDRQVKAWRFLADVLHSAGGLLEVCTILSPPHFLLLAVSGNALKAAAALAGMATRANLAQEFMVPPPAPSPSVEAVPPLGGPIPGPNAGPAPDKPSGRVQRGSNLADLLAKTDSQGVVAGVAGTIIGLGLTQGVGMTSPAEMLVAFGVGCAAQLVLTKKMLDVIVLHEMHEKHR